MECRLCLGPLSDDSFVLVFDSSDDGLLKQQILFCCNLHVEENDGFPDKICISCRDKLDSFTIFRNDCIQSDETLKARSNEILIIKTENIVPDILMLPDECVSNSSTEIPESSVDCNGCESSALIICDLKEANNTSQFLQEGENVSSCTGTSGESRCKCHAINKSYQCHDCLKMFNTKGSLTSHIKSHKIKSQLSTLKSTTGMEFSTNQRGNTNLTYLGFQYNKFRESKDTNVITWRCTLCRSSGCKAYIKTYGNSIVGEPSAHSHDSCPQKAKANIALSKMRESVKHVNSVKQVIGNGMIGLDDDIVAHLPKRSSIIRGLMRHKRLQSLKA